MSANSVVPGAQQKRCAAYLDDAMAYMNLMYRELADIQWGDRKAHENNVRTADKCVDVTMTTKKAKAEKPSSKLPQKQN